MERVPVEQIRDNPFQTRQVYEITDLANSILAMRAARPETSGLLQVPVGRIVLVDGRVLDPEEYGGVEPCLGDEPAAVVELATGHRRLRAFERLADNWEGEEEEYETFPVEIEVLSDDQMADIAWAENQEREDLTPIEEARALGQAIETFDWTQAQVGERWGLSQSAVANKLRLLKLPDEAQAAIQSGAISERHGRVLLKAMGKSPAIYAKAALEIVPLPVEEKAAAKAREIVGDQRAWYNGMLSRITDLDSQRCAACGGPVGHPDSDKVPTVMDGNRDVYFCLACARAAQGWEPPSVAGAEDRVERVIDMWSLPLDGGDFPLKEAVAGDDPLVQAAVCGECDYRSGAICLDKTCFMIKKQRWYDLLVLKFQAACRERWPEDSLPEVISWWGGNDHSKYSETEKGMVASGHCGPHCDRLRFRHSTHGIQPFEGLPFIFNCNNTNAKNACRKRYLKSLETDETKAEAKAQERRAKERKEAARAFLKRAEASAARALLQEHEGAWCELAKQMGAKKTRAGQSLATSVSQVAREMVSGERVMTWANWESEGAEDRFEEEIRDKLARMGVGLAPGVEELAGRLAKMKGFLLDEHGLPRADLTPEQVAGNADNLAQLMADVEALPASPEQRAFLEELQEQQALFPGKSSEDLGPEWVRAPVAVEYEVEA